MTRTLPDPKQEPTIEPERVAAILNISPRHAYECLRRGEIPGRKLGRR